MGLDGKREREHSVAGSISTHTICSIGLSIILLCLLVSSVGCRLGISPSRLKELREGVTETDVMRTLGQREARIGGTYLPLIKNYKGENIEVWQYKTSRNPFAIGIFDEGDCYRLYFIEGHLKTWKKVARWHVDSGCPFVFTPEDAEAVGGLDWQQYNAEMGR